MKKVCFTACSDEWYYPGGMHIFVNSFKRFHPDIPLVVFRQNTVNKLFEEKNINWFQCKPYFAQLLEDKYDLIVNIDGDTIVLDRLVEVFDKVDYDICSAWNYNEYENSSFANISEKMYVQAGLVGSTSKDFWKVWREDNRGAMKYLRKENDILNLVWYNHPRIKKLKRKIVDRKKDYYGCKSLGQEPLFRIANGKTLLKGEHVKAYHFARGNTFPKLDIDEMPLLDDVKQNWKDIAYFGQSVTIL